MKVSVDLAAVEAKGYFGTKIFADNLKKALLKYDKNHQYHFYNFFRVRPKIFWMTVGVSLAEFRIKPDVFLGLNQALPLYLHKKAIVFSHGLSFYFYPQYYSKKKIWRLNHQLKGMLKRADKIIVSSKKVKDEFLSFWPNLKEKIIVIPFGIPFDCLKYQPKKIKKKFFLTVGGNQPIKNFSFIKKTFQEFKKTDNKFKLIDLNNVKRESLISLYREATALLTASFYESFNLPVLEALSLGCPVVGLKSAIIPELRDYVNLANNKADFLKMMKRLPKQPTKKIITQLKKKFNWSNYVKELIKLY